MEHFATTRWSLVLDARESLTPQAQGALASLCELYWYPLYAYLRRRGHTVENAQDLTQGFFARLLEKRSLRVVDRARGRFRSFLLASLDNYVSNERDREYAQKRGGGTFTFSLDGSEAEERYRLEPQDQLTPETIFDRNWALTVLDRVLTKLSTDLHAEGKGELFERLKPCLIGDPDRGSYQELAEALGMTEAAVKVAVHRLRRRYRQRLHAEIAQTVEHPEDVDLELRHLIAAVKV